MNKEKEKVYDYTRKHPHYLVIYYEGSHQIVHPTIAFDQNWKALAEHVSEGSYVRFEVK